MNKNKSYSWFRFQADLENVEREKCNGEGEDDHILLDEYNSDDEKYKDESDDEEEIDSEEHITKVFIWVYSVIYTVSRFYVINSCSSNATELLINGSRN